MIHIPQKVPKPKRFDSDCGRPGNAWLRANPGSKRPKPFWIPFTEDLARGFGHLCGYCAMVDFTTGGTVDHYVSVNARRDLAYEWSNYRFASQTMNACKKVADATVLDPYEVGPGWFQIILPSMQMRVTDRVPIALRAKAEFTIVRLGLRDGERVLRARRAWYAEYQAGHLPLETLRRYAPLVAEAVSKAIETASKTTSARRSRTG